MVKFYLNEDNSVVGELKAGKVFLSTNHTNTRNSQRLIKNINSVLKISSKGSKTDIILGDQVFVSVNKNNIVNKHKLTSFETRLFSQSASVSNLPFDRKTEIDAKLKTDLHTHFAGALPPEKLIEIGIGQGIVFKREQLQKIGINANAFIGNEKDEITLEDVISNENNKIILQNVMKIDTSEQETFNRMEEIYALRGPFTKNHNMFLPMVKEIAKDCSETGIEYIELSLSSVISDTKQLELLAENLPKIEKQTGVKIRFLGALWRHSDKEWNNDEIDRLKVSSLSKYVVGIDFMGHETNSTMEFYNNIKEMAKHSIINDPNLTIRVHAGENPLFKSNVRQALLAVKEAHDELQATSKKPLPYPQVRLGHGIYGLDEPAPWDEKDSTKDISTLELCKEIKPIIEFNMSSNLSLNNINNLDIIPIKQYIDSGIDVVLGTDGRGIYSTSIKQEMFLAQQAGLTQEDFKKIENTEKNILAKSKKREKAKSNNTVAEIAKKLETCYTDGKPQYNEKVANKYRQQHKEMQNRLNNLISHSGAETDLEKINEIIAGKKPILITGSSAKHWPKISEENQERVRNTFSILSEVLDPQKVYLITGGTNHGVEKEVHIIMNERNKTKDDQLVVLGTLTEEAAQEDYNSVEKDTITHAVIAQMNGRSAKKWFDLPDAVLSIVQQSEGFMLAVGGGPIVSDMIQRAHNNGIDINLMKNIEGASGEKSEALIGNDYGFDSVMELIDKIKKQIPDAIRPELDNEKIEKIIRGKEMETKKFKLTSLNPEKYPDTELEARVVKDMKDYVSRFLKHQEKKDIYPGIAQKTVLVNARPGVLGEEVDTRPRVEKDGKIYVIGETKGSVKIEGSMIVMNPDGEEYIVKPDAFDKKYKPTSSKGVYEPIADPIKYIETTENIVFEAPWGGDMYAVKGAALNISSMSDIYAIQNEAFRKTYTQGPSQNFGKQLEI